MKKAWLLLLTLGAGPACQLFCDDSNSCGCGRPKTSSRPGYYDIEGVSLTAVSGTGGGNVVLAPGSAVSRAALRLWLAPTTRYFTALPSAPGGAGVAWACSPAPPAFVEQLDSVLVRSRYAYDAGHPAGTPLNDLLATDDYQGLALPDYLRQAAGQPEERLPLRLTAPPAAAGPQQLVVRYRLRNGEVHTAETPVFTLQP